MNIITVLWWMIGFLVFFSIGFGIFFWSWSRTYRFKLELYDKITGLRPVREKVYRMRKMRIRDSVQEETFYIPKLKTYFTAYGERMAKNTYWVLKGPDGFLYNFTLKDFTLKDGKMSINPVHKDVRAQHTANQKNINERYSQPKNWPVVLMSFTIVLSLLIVFVGGWLLFDKQADSLDKSNALTEQNIKMSGEIMKTSGDILLSLEKIINGPGSSGLISAQEVEE